MVCFWITNFLDLHFFLAAMSSSRSDVVTQSVCPFVRLSVCPFVRSSPFFLLVSLKCLLVVKSFKSVSRQFKECLKFNGSFKEVLSVFQGCLKGVSRKFQECFKEVTVKKGTKVVK